MRLNSLLAIVIFVLCPLNTALAQDDFASSPEWRKYCTNDAETDGLCFVSQRIECVYENNSNGFCKVGNDSRFQENNWANFLCTAFSWEENFCIPTSDTVSCYSIDDYSSASCPIQPYDAGGFNQIPEVFTVGMFAVPLFDNNFEEMDSDKEYYDSLANIGIFSILGIVFLAVVGGTIRRQFSRSTSRVAETPPPPVSPSPPSRRTNQIERLDEADVTVSARIVNWRSSGEIDVEIINRQEGE